MVSVASPEATPVKGKIAKDESVKISETNGAPAGGSAPLNLSILSEVRAAQGAHGLKKRNDFQHYRRYCTRRIQRTRRCTSTTNGRGRYAETPIDTAAILRDSRSILIPLYSAERAWAFAMDVKRNSPSGPARSRRKVVGRLTKAVVFASQLRALCVDSNATSDTCLEAEAYARWMSATLSLERERWAAALSDFERASTVYGGLAGVRAGTAAAAVFEEFVEEITQVIRFCKYNISIEGDDGNAEDDLRGLAANAANYDDLLAEKIEGALTAARKRAALSFGEVEWCGKKVELRSEVVRESVLAVKEETEALEKQPGPREPDHYDLLFIAYSDAAKVVQNELKQFRAATVASAEKRIEELDALAAYLAYGRLTNTVERNKLLVEAAKARRGVKPDDFVRLYDTLVHNVTDIAALHGVADDAEKTLKAQSQRALFQAYRCFHLARCYLVSDMHQAAERLFDRAIEHASPLSKGTHAAEAESVLKEAAGLRVRARAQLFLRETRAARMVDTVKGGIMGENLTEFVSYAKTDSDGVRKIAQMPPALEAVPCKPVLFDLALDAIEFPGDWEREQRRNETETLEKKEEDKSTSTTSAAASALGGTRLARWWTGKG